MDSCNCEHYAHFSDTSYSQVRTGHDYLGVPAGEQTRLYLGAICDDCAADNHGSTPVHAAAMAALEAPAGFEEKWELFDSVSGETLFEGTHADVRALYRTYASVKLHDEFPVIALDYDRKELVKLTGFIPSEPEAWFVGVTERTANN